MPEEMTLAQYLSANGIEVAAVDSAHAARLGIVAKIPAGWDALSAETFPGATEVLVEQALKENGFTPNAVLLVGKLSTTVDAHELLDCSFADARVMPGWVEGAVDSDDLAGWPSRFIRGTFTAEQLHLAVTTRYVVVGVGDQYLVQLTVTALADQMDTLAFDVDEINAGLLV